MTGVNFLRYCLAKEGKLLKRSEEWNLFFNVHNDAAPAVRLHKR